MATPTLPGDCDEDVEFEVDVETLGVLGVGPTGTTTGGLPAVASGGVDAAGIGAATTGVGAIDGVTGCGFGGAVVAAGDAGFDDAIEAFASASLVVAIDGVPRSPASTAMIGC